MWLLSFLPEYFFHLLTLLGFVGALACLFPIPYKTIVQVISIAVIAFSLYMEGGIANEAEWKLKVKEAEAKAAGADHVGLDDYIAKIKGGWTDVDVIITMPSVMGKVGALGRILGPRGLMPNPKTGTVTLDVAKAVAEVKAGKIDFKVDKYGIIHSAVGKVSFNGSMLKENANELIQALIKLKPSAAKGTYIKSIALSSTMSAGIQIDTKSVTA